MKDQSARCDCLPNGAAAALRGQFCIGGKMVDVAGYTEHAGDVCLWRVTAQCGNAEATKIDPDVAAALRDAVASVRAIMARPSP